MNSQSKISSNNSIEDFSDSDTSQDNNQVFIPTEPNLLNQIMSNESKKQSLDSHNESNIAQPMEVKSAKKQPQSITKDYLKNCISASKDNRNMIKSKSHWKENTNKNLPKQNSVQEQYKKKVSKINQKLTQNQVQDLLQKNGPLMSKEYIAIYQYKLRQDNVDFDNMNLVNKDKEEKKQKNMKRNNAKRDIQKLIHNEKIDQRQLEKKARKIQIKDNIKVEDVIDSFVYTMFQVKEHRIEIVMQAFKNYIDSEEYLDRDKDYYFMTRSQILKRLLKLIKSDNYGQYQFKNVNLIQRYYKLQILDLKTIKSLILYLMYFSTKYLVEKDFFNAEQQIYLIQDFYKAFYHEINSDRQFGCHFYFDENYLNLLSIYAENCNNIKYFVFNSVKIMQIFDALLQNEKINLSLLMLKIYTVFIHDIGSQQIRPAILRTIKEFTKILQKNQLIKFIKNYQN